MKRAVPAGGVKPIEKIFAALQCSFLAFTEFLMGAASDSRKKIKVLIRKDLLDAVSALNIDAPFELERALEKRIKTSRAERWLEENREAIAAYNRHVEEHGLWNESFRLW